MLKIRIIAVIILQHFTNFIQKDGIHVELNDLQQKLRTEVLIYFPCLDCLHHFYCSGQITENFTQVETNVTCTDLAFLQFW